MIGYGNPGRLDDGLGPALAGKLEQEELPNVTVDSDYQLTVEDAAAVAQHEVVIFADAAVDGDGPYYFRRLEPADSAGFSTHHISPAGVLGLARACFGAAPRGYVLGIRGYEFDDFGEGLSPKARGSLSAAFDFLLAAIRRGDFDDAADTTPDPQQ